MIVDLAHGIAVTHGIALISALLFALIVLLVLTVKHRRLCAVEQSLLQQNLQLQNQTEQLKVDFNSQLAVMDARLDEKSYQAHNLEKQVHELQQEISKLQVDNARLSTAMTEKQRHYEQQLALLEQNKQVLKQEFSQLANDIFEAKGKTFSEQNTQQIDHLLKPFKEQLSDFRNKVESARQEDFAGRAALKQQLETLYKLNQQITTEASNLTQALQGDKKLQGNWGEIQVEKLLESSGLLKDTEYQREANFKDGEGNNMRPDFIVHLPEGKHLIIDSKVSLVDYLAYVSATDEDTRARALNRHVQCVRAHINALSHKDYPSLPGLQAPDFVFMFMPIEPSFLVAFQHDQKLFLDAFERRIVVVTPTTLLATLRTVANLWSIERQNSSARILAEKAAGLYNKLRVFVDKMEKLDGQFVSSRKTYDEAMNTLKSGPGNIIKQAQEFLALGVRVKKEISAHTLQTSELTADIDTVQSLATDLDDNLKTDDADVVNASKANQHG